MLIHAGAGGVGLLLIQMAKRLGARVLTTVSTEEKAALAREAGADETILYTREDFAAKVPELTGGKGVPVVYDSVGKTTFDGSLACLRPRGMMVLYGGSSGAVPPFDLIQLSTRGSLYITRPTLKDYIRDPRGAGAARRRGAGLGRRRQPEAAAGTQLSAGRSSAGAPRPGGTQDHGEGVADSVAGVAC